MEKTGKENWSQILLQIYELGQQLREIAELDELSEKEDVDMALRSLGYAVEELDEVGQNYYE